MQYPHSTHTSSTYGEIKCTMEQLRVMNLTRNTGNTGRYYANESKKLQYQGVCPPVRRTEENFDIGAKYHIASDTEYWRYYVSNILQFQIHESLCNEAGITGPYHNCTIYKNRKAGKILAKLLKKGKSQCWKKALKIFSRNKFNKLDADSLLRYFAPLMKWLKKKNKKAFKGWKSSDPMICPGGKDSTSGTPSILVSTPKGLI
ncbi:angiotensin-converting enzyme [Trichonephila inaurata madagascariensis]|uniref:Angiotensin-converting enzyme n=1 Tax=Trichonephila inaurata madagascariensis TaxID=2747483 RepID=A0A8X6WNA8_9ARAC|nr:angiotensin-converting enzyme [Trichonephila inaurata madagascariensis]